ncbi:LAETG motif-containing sortase-dependent surface protein [Kitasatospora sp. NPDC002040]|uniref:LAETG motif-containing sortase-dependent surface protein n=1 Tax=Kitasatospora sp. NPDC002040 TaxID=3154661 RepID=UPI00331CB2F5
MAGLRALPGGLITGAVGLGVLTPLLLAGSAAAHTSEWTLDCDRVSLRVTGYDPQYSNRITLTVGGEKLLDHQAFGAAFSQDFPVKAHTGDLAVELSVTTDEQPKNPVTRTGTVKPCPPPSPSPTPSPSVSRTPAPTPTPTRKPSPKPSAPQLAETGGGSHAGVIAAAGAGVLVVGGALVLISRRRSR